MLLRLAYYDEPILRKKVDPVEKIDDEIKKLVEDMIETMIHHDGAGLAAPQVFHSISLFLTYIPKKDENGNWLDPKVRVYINPKVVSISQQTWSNHDGCLSIPKLHEEISRPYAIKVEATDLERDRFEEELTGWEAWAFLHENDHLNGVLFIDRIRGKRRREIEPLLQSIKKRYQGK